MVVATTPEGAGPADVVLGVALDESHGARAAFREAAACFEAAGLVATTPASEPEGGALAVLELRISEAELRRAAERMGIEKEVRDDKGLFRPGQPYMRRFEEAHAADFVDPHGFTLAQRQTAAYFVAKRVRTSPALAALLRVGGTGADEGGTVLFDLERAGALEFRAAGHDREWRRRLLKTTLAQVWSQPVDELCAYYGSEVAIYMAWMIYTVRMLLVPAAGGVALHLTRGTSVDSSPWAPVYGILVAVWAVAYVKLWDRQAAALSYRWGTLGHDTRPEAPYVHVRASFVGERRISDVTGRPTLYYPAWRRSMAYLVSLLVTLGMLAVAFAVMVCTHNFMGYMPKGTVLHIAAVHQFSDPGRVFDPLSWLSLVPICSHSLLIMALNGQYSRVAAWLTERENHKTKAAHEFSLLLKRFLFEALDCYLPLFYLALFRRDSNILRLELMALFTTDSVRRIATELLLPWLQARLAGPKVAGADKSVAADAAEAAAAADYEPFDDYLEICVTFGYVTMFASAFPLASALAILASLVELRSDAVKIAHVVRKPTPRGVSNIGLFSSVLKCQAMLAILTNCYIVGFASDQLVAWVPSWFKHVERKASEVVLEAGQQVMADTEVFREGAARWAVAAVFGLEHVVGLVCVAILVGWSSSPSWVRRRQARAALDNDREIRGLREAVSASNAGNAVQCAGKGKVKKRR